MAGSVADPIRGDSEPDRWWTLTNVSEATPLVLAPLEWSYWSRALEFGGRGAWCDFGLLGPSEVYQPVDQNERLTGCFFGRQAVNVDRTREIIGIIPGRSTDDFERDVFGMVRPGLKPVPNRYRRFPVIAWKSGRTLSQHTADLEHLYAEQLQWWRTQVLDGGTRDPWRLMEESGERFVRLMRAHVRSRMVLQVLQSMIRSVCARRQQEHLVHQLLSGYGNVANTLIAEDIWLVSRGRLSRDEVIREHGFHGPNEGNQRARSWREDPSGIDALVRAIGRRAENDRPRVRERLAVEARLRAEAELLEGRRGLGRVMVRMLLRAAATAVRNLELGKAAYVSALDGNRAGARGVGAQLCAAGWLAEADDVFYLTRDELLSGEWSAERADLICRRRKQHAEYQGMTLPVSFVGVPSPCRAPEAPAQERAEIKGMPGAPGRVWGRARLVLDPDGAEPLDEGEILVCRTTDPGWVALFALADGLVIDIGGPASHGAIVARELGIPCVIGTGDGTRRLTTGDRVEVDGDTGVVTLLPTPP
ncbi:hypothetical protein GCM10023321_05960 [Pseudonocardia eucalypti]|uniref:PEP-utilising enzyme mobile domain-containing protein n=1 Tax=Pseudonocardia eucalypti TaxID=648755 RepID=A0ABP9PNC5_9PSEU|nr:pyruvate,water dikinase [Pseudonocardia eucalypti]